MLSRAGVKPCFPQEHGRLGRFCSWHTGQSWYGQLELTVMSQQLIRNRISQSQVKGPCHSVSRNPRSLGIELVLACCLKKGLLGRVYMVGYVPKVFL